MRAQPDSHPTDLSGTQRSTLLPDALLLALLLALAALPYLNTLHNLFVYDDNTQVVNNPYLQNFHHLREIFTTPVWSFLGGNYARNYYRPLMSFGVIETTQVQRTAASLVNPVFGCLPGGLLYGNFT